MLCPSWAILPAHNSIDYSTRKSKHNYRLPSNWNRFLVAVFWLHLLSLSIAFFLSPCWVVEHVTLRLAASASTLSLLASLPRLIQFDFSASRDVGIIWLMVPYADWLCLLRDANQTWRVQGAKDDSHKLLLSPTASSPLMMCALQLTIRVLINGLFGCSLAAEYSAYALFHYCPVRGQHQQCSICTLLHWHLATGAQCLHS